VRAFGVGEGMEVMEDLIIVKRSEWESTLSRILDEKLKPLLTPPPDTTPLSDKEVAERLGKSISTVTRWKRNNKLKTIGTPSGRMVRACDLTEGK
jgi:transcriptional regulator with XRE-family HTH domain